MQNEPLVSVVMNCYNSDTYLEQAIESIINQTYQNWEIIFWDNQSTDNSALIVKSYNDKRIKYFYAPKFTPLGEARNFAIDKCNGSWIGFLDCDDLWDKAKLSLSFEALSNLSNQGDISLIYSKSNIIDKNNKIISRFSNTISGNIHDKLLIEGNFIIFSSIIIRKNILNKHNNINDNLNYCEDYELLLKVCKDSQVIGVNKYLTSYRVHSNNITSTKIFENTIEYMNMLDNYLENNNISSIIRFNVFLNMSYAIGVLFIKLLFIKKFDKNIFLIKNYFNFLLSFPFSIVWIKIK
jgi:glycosyltransferase involved in cell wall biosynthesis